MTRTSTANTLDLAAAHVATGAELLEAQDTSEGLFSPARSLAAQLALIGNGISPGITPVEGILDSASAVSHVDQALMLMDSLDPRDAPPDLVVWALRLHELRPRVTALLPPRQ